MARINTYKAGPKTHEGGRAMDINPEQSLRRSVMSCLLWEDTFYENGVSIAQRIEDLVPQVKPGVVGSIAIEAREQMKLRHVPLLLVDALSKDRSSRVIAGETLERVIQRPDEITEFLAIYNRKGKHPLANQLKKGIANAFKKFDAYQLAKWDRDGKYKLRDAAFLTHPKPATQEQAQMWARLVNKERFTMKYNDKSCHAYGEFFHLPHPDTWEVALSAGKNKKDTWVRLISENKLGALALLRNLRNMDKVGVEDCLVKHAIKNMRVSRVLPFRFITAARYAPRLESELEEAMIRGMANFDKLKGTTILLIDVSGSMESKLSGKSELLAMDAAGGLAILARELAENVRVLTFSEKCVEIPARRGFALRDAIVNSQDHGRTYLAGALDAIYKQIRGFDRIIVITDEQAHDNVFYRGGKGYIINVMPYLNGVGYGRWVHIDGWSENVLRFVQEYEK